MHNLSMRYLMFKIDEKEMQRTSTIVRIHQPPFHPYSIHNQMWLIRILTRMGYIKKKSHKIYNPNIYNLGNLDNENHR
jgi:hypothetical protein